VIQAPKPERRIIRYELSDYEWTAIKPMLPNKSRGVRRVNDRRVLNGAFWVLRSGAPWRDLPATYGPRTSCYNRFVRRRRAGVWDQIMDALAAGHDAAVQMIDTSVVRVHQHGACVADNNHQDMGRSRGGLTSYGLAMSFQGGGGGMMGYLAYEMELFVFSAVSGCYENFQRALVTRRGSQARSGCKL
jgi:transposase